MSKKISRAQFTMSDAIDAEAAQSGSDHSDDEKEKEEEEGAEGDLINDGEDDGSEGDDEDDGGRKRRKRDSDQDDDDLEEDRELVAENRVRTTRERGESGPLLPQPSLMMLEARSDCLRTAWLRQKGCFCRKRCRSSTRSYVLAVAS